MRSSRLHVGESHTGPRRTTARPADMPALVAPADRHGPYLTLLPGIEARARASFRFVRCPHDRDDAVAEVVARAWEQFVTGTAPPDVPDALAGPAVAAVRDEL